MIHFLSSVLRTFKTETFKIGIALIILWCFSVWSMSVFEGWVLWKTTWWFIVTITTVGYGDISPATLLGQISGIVVILGGIGLGALLIGNVVSTLITFRGRKMKGLGDYVSMENHVVVMGWHGVHTERIIDQIRLDKHSRKVILCSESLEELPQGYAPMFMLKEVNFVKGVLSSEDVLHRAGVKTADKIIIYGKNDEETILTALAVISCDDGDKADITVLIDSEDNVHHVERLTKFHGSKISIVKSLDTDLIVQEMQDKGVAKIFEILLDNGSEATPYRLDCREFLRYGEVILPGKALKIACIDTNNELVINPDSSTIVRTVFYISNERHKEG